MMYHDFPEGFVQFFCGIACISEEWLGGKVDKRMLIDLEKTVRMTNNLHLPAFSFRFEGGTDKICYEAYFDLLRGVGVSQTTIDLLDQEYRTFKRNMPSVEDMKTEIRKRLPAIGKIAADISIKQMRESISKAKELENDTLSNPR